MEPVHVGRGTTTLALGATLLLGVGCASVDRIGPASRSEQARVERLAGRGGNYVERGLASWYGPEFNGRATASGERFDMNQPSAAHRSLPFGTVIEVRNLDNGRTLWVRVNDRGPFVRDRILDLSRAAADELGVRIAGVARVELRVVRWPEEVGPVTERENPEPAIGPFLVQLGAFREEPRAERYAERAAKIDGRARVYADDQWFRVQVRGLSSDQAERLRRRFLHAGIEAVVRRESSLRPAA